jgi:hypothetical protein
MVVMVLTASSTCRTRQARLPRGCG